MQSLDTVRQEPHVLTIGNVEIVADGPLSDQIADQISKAYAKHDHHVSVTETMQMDTDRQRKLNAWQIATAISENPDGLPTDFVFAVDGSAASAADLSNFADSLTDINDTPGVNGAVVVQTPSIESLSNAFAKGIVNAAKRNGFSVHNSIESYVSSLKS